MKKHWWLTLPAKNDLNDHGAGKNTAELHTEGSRIRNHRIFHHMTEKDFSGGKTFGLRRHDVLLAPHLGNCALHQHEITGSPVKNHDNQRQEHMLEDALHPRLRTC